MLSLFWLAALSWLCIPDTGLANEAPQTSDLPLYEKVKDLPSGVLQISASDVMLPLMLTWAEDFTQLYPQVSIQMRSGNAQEVFEQLKTDPTKKLIALSRELTAVETNEFKEQFGYDPRDIRVAIDGLAIYVNQTNPISSISLEQLNHIYSDSTDTVLEKWGQLGLKGSWAEHPIVPVGFDVQSSSYDLFHKVVLPIGGYRSYVQTDRNPWDILNMVEQDAHAIGYAGITLRHHPGVKPIAIMQRSVPVELTRFTALSGDYPLARSLYVYLGIRPTERLPIINQEFFRYIFSQQGQNTVVRRGMFSLQASMAAKMIRRANSQGLIFD